MNIVESMIELRVDALLKELEIIAEEIITTGQVKSKSLAIADITTQDELDPELAKRLGIVHIQLGLLKTLVGE